MEIKKLSQEEIDEGLTLEFVNSINMKKKYSPVMFGSDEEPCPILKCSKGYWKGLGNFQYERDTNDNLVVYKEKECHIARARYLLYHIEEEKTQEAERILDKRKERIQKKLDEIQKRINEYKQYENPDSSISIMIRAFQSEMTEEQKVQSEAKIQQKIELIPKLEAFHKACTDDLEKGNLNYLLSVLDIEKIPNPMSFQYDNPKDMEKVKAFTKTIMGTGNVDLAYARLQTENQY